MPLPVADNTGVPLADVPPADDPPLGDLSPGDVPPGDVLAIVAAHNEAERIAETIAGLRAAWPGAEVWVADDGSGDGTAAIARAAGARVVSAARRAGKGQAMTAAVVAALKSGDRMDESDDWMDCETRVCARVCACARVNNVLRGSSGPLVEAASAPLVVLCDGDLGACARELAPLAQAIRRGDADLAIAAFSTRASGGFGIALAFARWVVRRRCGLRARAPLSGQRALRAGLLRELLPFAPGYGMELGMTIDAARAGARVVEIDLPLSHRPTGRTLAGFAHRARQLVDFVRVYLTGGSRSVRAARQPL